MIGELVLRAKPDRDVRAGAQRVRLISALRGLIDSRSCRFADPSTGKET